MLFFSNFLCSSWFIKVTTELFLVAFFSGIPEVQIAIITNNKKNITDVSWHMENVECGFQTLLMHEAVKSINL